ncbi:MAG: aspartate aminotransferase family protein [Bacteroidota bacterium]
MSRPKITFPEQAASLSELEQIIQEKRINDVDWKKGKAFCLVYHPGEECYEKIKTIYNLYFSDNALNPTATPSLAELEAETVSMCADLFNGDENVRGNITTGGTESILLAVKTARDFAKKNSPKISKGNVIVPASVHPAFMKAFHYFELDFISIEVDKNGRADAQAMKNAINENTIMMVASAPSYPHGLMDPIEEIAAIAKENNILCHVDACVGGFMLPFVKRLGHTIPAFDFSVEGVTSISADIHKYGYSSKGSSVILYKNADLRKSQFSLYTKWNGGIYGSPTMTGTRPGGSIAGAWAALKGIGMDGYLEMAKVTMEVTQKIRNAINDNPKLELIGDPEISILAFQSSKIDVFRLADELNKKGWHFERQQLPPSLHFTINYIHRLSVDDFIKDLNACVEEASKFSVGSMTTGLQVGIVKGLSKILPSGTIAKLQKNGTDNLKKENTAAMYGMMGALSGTDDLEEIVLDFLDKVNSVK